MSEFYVALDTNNEPTIFRMTDDLPKAVLRRCDLTAHTTDAWGVLTGHLEVFQ